MIISFRNAALRRFWNDGDRSKIRPDHIARLRRRLVALHAANRPEDLNVGGFNFHQLQGKPKRFSIHISGPWCVTFGWDGKNAVDVDYEQYH